MPTKKKVKSKPLTRTQELAQLDNDLQVLESDKDHGGNVEIIDQTIKAINDRIKHLKGYKRRRAEMPKGKHKTWQ